MLTTVLEGQFFAEKYGEGDPEVLALHGWGRSRLDWNATLEGVPAIAVDLPGFGTAAPPTDAWGSSEYAEALLPLVRQLERPVLAGHSFGGRVAVRIAAAQPEIISGLVLTGAPLVRMTTAFKPARLFRLARFLSRINVISDSQMERVRNKYGSVDYLQSSGVMRHILVRLLGEDYSESLDLIARAGVPLRLVWGETDSEVSLQVAEAIRDRVPHAQLSVVPSSGHLLDLRLSAAIKKAITELRPAETVGN